MKLLYLKVVILSWLVILGFYFFGCSNNKTSTTSGADSTKTDSTFVASTDTTPHIDVQKIHICTELLPPSRIGSGIVTQRDTSIYYRDKRRNDTLILDNIVKLNAAILIQKNEIRNVSYVPFKWGHGNLTVTFLDGDPVVQQKVIATAKEWEQYCGIHFNFGTFTNADITISFKYEGSWSLVGKYSAQVSPSMNLGWLDRDTNQDEYNRVVLHEFGHALGFLHEHTNPNGNHIQWNKPLVYEYYKGPPNNWDKLDVDQNIFAKYNLKEINSSVFDPNSIMLYEIPAFLTTNGYSTHSNSKISDLDKQYAAKLYPTGI